MPNMQPKKPSKSNKSEVLQEIKNIPSLLIKQAVEELEIKPNVSHMARHVGVTQATMWHWMGGYNPWPAEAWLKVLIILGYVVEGRNSFEIHLPKSKAMCKIFDELSEVDPSDRTKRLRKKGAEDDS
jgi:hypothetical protein